MPWKARVTSRFCSSQGLVQSFATRAKVASCTEKCWVSRSKKKVTAIFIPKCCKAQRLLPCGRFLRRRSLVLAKIPGLTIFLLRKRGLSLTLTASTKQRRSLNREDIECSSRTRKNHGAKSSVASSHRKDYWWALLLLPRCEDRNSSHSEKRVVDASWEKAGSPRACVQRRYGRCTRVAGDSDRRSPPQGRCAGACIRSCGDGEGKTYHSERWRVVRSDSYGAAEGCDALLVLTEWKEFANLDLDRVRSVLKYPIVIDGRNLYDPKEMADAGLLYYSIGRAVGVPRAMSFTVHSREATHLRPIASSASLQPAVTAL